MAKVVKLLRVPELENFTKRLGWIPDYGNDDFIMKELNQASNWKDFTQPLHFTAIIPKAVQKQAFEKSHF